MACCSIAAPMHTAAGVAVAISREKKMFYLKMHYIIGTGKLRRFSSNKIS